MASIDMVLAKDALVVLGAAAVIVPVMRRLTVNPILAFLAAGALLGPYGLGSLAGAFPWIEAVTVSNPGTLAAIAELGVVFLLFVIGLELSWERLMNIRRLVFGMGGLQVLLSAGAIAAAASPLLPTPGAALVVGACLALSSTAIVVELLAASNRVTSATGRASFAVLLFQDVAVVPILFFVGVLGARGEGSVATGLVLALGQAALTIAGIVLLGRFLLRPLFRLVAGPNDTELFIAATLLVAVGAGVLAQASGLSMALGAFTAGLLLAETEFRRAIEATIEPFKSLLLGTFFFAVGMSLDLGRVAAEPLFVIGAVLGVMAIKGLIVIAVARLFHQGWPASVESALLLGPSGEFAFVIAASAAAFGILSRHEAGVLVTVATLSMVMIPLMARLGRLIAARLEPPLPAAVPEPLPEDGTARAIVVGFGRVGRVVADMLDRHQVPWLALDSNARAVARLRHVHRGVYWGDAGNDAVLRRCGLVEARALIITIDDPKAIESVVAAARALRPDLPIIARARDADHASRLYGLGVTDAVPETVEASLQLSEAALAGLGIAAGLAIASIHEKRDEVRRALQAAAGRTDVRAIREKRRPEPPA